MRELKVGIMGLGWAGGAHVEMFGKVRGAAVAAVCTRRPLTESAARRKYGLPLRVYRDYADMLADPALDIVSICTRSPEHAAQAIAAARAGKHVVIEKPIAMNWRDAQAVARAVEKAGVRSCVCFEVRFSRQFSAIKALVDAGKIGRIHLAEVDYYHGVGPWYPQVDWYMRAAGGGSSLLTAGCHAMDMLLWLMDEPVAEVTACATKSESPFFAGYEYPTTTVALLKFRSGRLGKCVSCIDSLQPYTFRVHLLGSRGTVLDDKIMTRHFKSPAASRWEPLGEPLVDSGDVHDLPYAAQFQAFVDAVREDRPMPRTDIGAALETHRVCFAVEKAARSGKTVRLPARAEN